MRSEVWQQAGQAIAMASPAVILCLVTNRTWLMKRSSTEPSRNNCARCAWDAARTMGAKASTYRGHTECRGGRRPSGDVWPMAIREIITSVAAEQKIHACDGVHP